MKPAEFIEALTPGAQAAQRYTGVPASVTIAQGALESGWGSHTPGNAIFGIKADSSWRGKRQMLGTNEVIHGRTVRVRAAFRAYSSWAASVEDHADFIKKNPRYAPAFKHTDDGIAFAQAIADAGYATDPDYARDLVLIIHAHNLLKLDKPEA